MQHSLPAACFLPLFLLYIIARSFFLPVAETVLSVPFVAEGVDLADKFGKILVGSAFVVVDNLHQSFSGLDQTGINIGFAFFSRLFGCYRDLQSFFDPFAGGKIKQCA